MTYLGITDSTNFDGKVVGSANSIIRKIMKKKCVNKIEKTFMNEKLEYMIYIGCRSSITKS